LNKTNGKIEWEIKNNKRRVVKYIGYPGNYGMIPQTLLSKENGGDGDPLDILILGAPTERGSIIKCKIIGVLNLIDRGEQDDKLIAVSDTSPMYQINSIKELDERYNGISQIVQLWFTNYKGPGKMSSTGYGNKESAIQILNSALLEYKNLN
jgi:inorganic pyrophosphatase